jgi:hypothetical protein
MIFFELTLAIYNPNPTGEE